MKLEKDICDLVSCQQPLEVNDKQSQLQMCGHCHPIVKVVCKDQPPAIRYNTVIINMYF